MFKKILIFIPIALFIGAVQVQAVTSLLPALSEKKAATAVSETILAQHEMSLANRYPVKSVSDIFKDNILLNVAYMTGKVQNSSQINWNALHEPTKSEIILHPGDVFAFHEDVLPQYVGKKVITTNAHFNAAEGFLSSGYLYGDGVCHLASLMNWVARDAGLSVVAPVNHNFARIPGISRDYGTAIYYSPGERAVNQQQNLYIENTLDKPVKFVFEYADDTLRMSVVK